MVFKGNFEGEWLIPIARYSDCNAGGERDGLLNQACKIATDFDVVEGTKCSAEVEAEQLDRRAQ